MDLLQPMFPRLALRDVHQKEFTLVLVFPPSFQVHWLGMQLFALPVAILAACLLFKALSCSAERTIPERKRHARARCRTCPPLRRVRTKTHTTRSFADETVHRVGLQRWGNWTSQGFPSARRLFSTPGQPDVR